MTAKTTTVTHADGTVSRRTSKTMTYAYAVEVKEDEHFKARTERDAILAHVAKLEAELAVLDTAPVTVERAPFLRGQEWITLRVGGQYVNSYSENVGEDAHRPTDEAVRALYRLELENYLRFAPERLAALEEKLAGPEFSYGVVRWSRTDELAAKGLREFEGAFKGRSVLRVVAVD